MCQVLEENASGQVVNEVRNAVNAGTVILPFRIDDTAMSKALRFHISAAHWIDAYPPPHEQYFSTLVDAVHGLMPPPQAATPREPDDSGATRPRAPDAAPAVIPAVPAAPLGASEPREPRERRRPQYHAEISDEWPQRAEPVAEHADAPADTGLARHIVTAAFFGFLVPAAGMLLALPLFGRQPDDDLLWSGLVGFGAVIFALVLYRLRRDG